MVLEAAEERDSGEDEELDQVAGEESATAWFSSSSMNATAKKMAHAGFCTGIRSSESHKSCM